MMTFFLHRSSRVHQHARPLLQRVLHVLPDRAGHVAGVLPAALLQGKEADRVERRPCASSRKKLPAGSRQTHPNIHPLWTSFSKTASVVEGLKILVFTAATERVPRLSSEKKTKEKRSTFLFRVWNVKSAVGKKCTVRHGRHRWNAAVLIVIYLSLCTVLKCCISLNKTLFPHNQLNHVWFLGSVEWMCHERMFYCPSVGVFSILPCQANKILGALLSSEG